MTKSGSIRYKVPNSILQRETENPKDLFIIGRRLGAGQFGTTYSCTEKATGKEYACKVIPKRKLLLKEDAEDVRREIQIMHLLSGHPNIVDIKGAYEDTGNVYMVMELCAGGELFDRITQRGHYSEAQASAAIRAILEAIEICHELGVFHRDLKPENFLLADKDEDAPLKVIDFGLSTYFKIGQFPPLSRIPHLFMGPRISHLPTTEPCYTSAVRSRNPPCNERIWTFSLYKSFAELCAPIAAQT